MRQRPRWWDGVGWRWEDSEAVDAAVRLGVASISRGSSTVSEVVGRLVS
jgi:hypothetical protein